MITCALHEVYDLDNLVLQETAWVVSEAIVEEVPWTFVGQWSFQWYADVAIELDKQRGSQ